MNLIIKKKFFRISAFLSDTLYPFIHGGSCTLLTRENYSTCSILFLGIIKSTVLYRFCPKAHLFLIMLHNRLSYFIVLFESFPLSVISVILHSVASELK